MFFNNLILTRIKTVLIFSVIEVTHRSPIDNGYLQRVQCVHVAFTSLNLAENRFCLT